MAFTFLALAAASLLVPAESSAPGATDTTDARTPHRVSLAIGTGAAFHNVDEDGHGSSGGGAHGVRLAYDHTINPWLELGVGFGYLAIDARAQHAFMPSLRARAHVGNDRIEGGLSLKAIGLFGLMTGSKVLESDGSVTTHDNVWSGWGAAASLDLRVWIGDTALELSPEVTFGTASGEPRGSYISPNLTHLSAIVWVGALRRF